MCGPCPRAAAAPIPQLALDATSTLAPPFPPLRALSLSATSPKAILQAHRLRAKKSFGQNFLADEGLLARIAALVPTSAGVVEIGAGLGALTRALVLAGHRVIAVERDRDLLPVLRGELGNWIATGQLTLLEADAKTVDYPSLLASLPKPGAIVGNLPYQLTGPLLRVACRLAPHVQRAVFLVQLEVAERLVAGVGDSAYGALSVFTRAAFDVQREMVVRRGAFYPQPKVDSAVVSLTSRPDPAPETEAFRALVKAAFEQRRKTLRNAWAAAFAKVGADLEGTARDAGIDLGARGESLDVAAFRRVSDLVDSKGGRT